MPTPQEVLEAINNADDQTAAELFRASARIQVARMMDPVQAAAMLLLADPQFAAYAAEIAKSNPEQVRAASEQFLGNLHAKLTEKPEAPVTLESLGIKTEKPGWLRHVETDDRVPVLAKKST